VARALDLTGELALAARAVAGLAARLDLAGFGDVAAQGVNVLVVKAAAFGAVNLRAAAAARATTARAPTGWARAFATFFFLDFLVEFFLLVASLLSHADSSPQNSVLVCWSVESVLRV